jgi:hypothetical protein
MYASQGGYVGVLESLLKHGADINAADKVNKLWLVAKCLTGIS